MGLVICLIATENSSIGHGRAPQWTMKIPDLGQLLEVCGCEMVQNGLQAFNGVQISLCYIT